MLIDECAQLSKLAQDATDLKKYAADLGKFRDRQNKIEELAGSLRPTVIALKTFRERELIDVDLSQNANALLSEIAITLAEFQKNKGWLIEQSNLKTVQAKVAALKSEIENYLRKSWSHYKEDKGQQILKINGELLELFERIEEFQATVQTLKLGLAKLKKVDFPRDTLHFEQIDQEINSLTTAWNSLKSDSVTEPVLVFLRAAATHGAPIELLTSEVVAWLTEQSITRFFHIRLSD